MTIPASHFEAKKHAYRQTQDGVVISFVVHPNDLNAALAVAPLGTRYMVAVAEIGDDDQPVQPNPSASDDGSAIPAGGGSKQVSRAEGPKRERTLAEKIGMLCNDNQFQGWIIGFAVERGWSCGEAPADCVGKSREEVAASIVRKICDVHTRANIKPGSLAAVAWQKVETRFMAETGRMAEAR